jgi:hypothetical protein
MEQPWYSVENIVGIPIYLGVAWILAEAFSNLVSTVFGINKMKIDSQKVVKNRIFGMFFAFGIIYIFWRLV